MSDITKKIFSIEPEAPVATKTPMSDVIRPVLADSPTPRAEHSTEEVPEFVTRETISPRSAPPRVSLEDEPDRSSAAGWVILGFAVMYLIGAGLYFGLPLLSQTPALMPITGLVMLLALPLVLLFLLWRALRHLSAANLQNARFSKAADILVSPDREVLNRSETLASGIQAQISKVNSSLDETLETLREVQLSVSRETQALDAAGLQLSSRSDDVGRNLTLQRQALESISGTFDTRMDTLSSHISETGVTLESICTDAEAKLLKAGEAMQIASGKMDQTVSEGAHLMSGRITEIDGIGAKLGETVTSLSEGLSASAQQISESEASLAEKTSALQSLNETTQAKINDLKVLITDGNQMLADLGDGAENRASSIQSHYDTLRSQLKHSEDETLAVQGRTARMVESNLAQMRQDFSDMETEFQALQNQLTDLRATAVERSDTLYEHAGYEDAGTPRLNLQPLDSDFPPVEPPRHAPTPAPRTKPVVETPLNLGADMEITSPDSEITDFDPDLIRRPGEEPSPGKTKGFGRRSGSEQRTGWRWRDMLGTLERPDSQSLRPISPSADGVGILTNLQLSPSAVVDEGTVIDATQARINKGEAGLIAVVSQKLPEAVSHLKKQLSTDPKLVADLQSFNQEFAALIGNTPPTAPALRAALGAPDGRAYLLSVAALKG